MGGDSSLLLRCEASEKLNSVHRDNIRELKKESKTKDKSSVELRALYVRIIQRVFSGFFKCRYSGPILDILNQGFPPLGSEVWIYILNTDNHCFGSLGLHVQASEKSRVLKAIFNSTSSIQV